VVTVEHGSDEVDERVEIPRFPGDVYVEVVRVLIIGMTTAVGDSVGGGPFAALGACCGYVLGGLLGRFLRRVAAGFEAHVQRTPAVTLVAGAIGALVAAGIGCIVGVTAVVLLPGRWGYPVLALAAWTGVYAGFQAGVRKGAELGQVLGRGAAALRDAERSGLVLVDSSAAMDGRLLALARAGFLPGDLAVPRFVLDELQGLSDASDPTRRRRARRALELLDVLRTDGPGLLVLPDEVPERDEVDAKLVALAVRRDSVILTADRGLAGVAAVEGVRALDVASLADSLRAGIVPGEIVPVRLTREGRDPGQAVGFLDDGTMIVVHDAADRIGDRVEVEVSTSVPTSKGRLYFATIVS
jgi:uncharacterized protein YacL